MVLAGEITTNATSTTSRWRATPFKRIGYDNTEYGIDYKGCAVLVAYDKQATTSPRAWTTPATTT